jgi:hypothetical protein
MMNDELGVSRLVFIFQSAHNQGVMGRLIFMNGVMHGCNKCVPQMRSTNASTNA